MLRSNEAAQLEGALITAAYQAAAQTRHEILLTEQTTVVSPEELGWLGIVTAGRSTLAPNCDHLVDVMILKCSRCHRMVIPARREVHRQQCMAASWSIQGQPQQSQPTSGYKFHAMLGGALGFNTSSKRGAGYSGSSGSGPLRSQAGKKSGSSRSFPASDQMCSAASGGNAQWEAPLPMPLPKARTNLSKVSYPYMPESGSLLDDFMGSIIDRFVFPHHLKRPRAGPTR
jgi:hypothetical protein